MMEAAPMFMVVVMSLAGRIEDVVGPFWYEDTANAFVRIAEDVHHKQCQVRRVVERMEWVRAQ